MGRDKARLVLNGESLLQRQVERLAQVVDEIVLVGAPGRPLPQVTSAVPCRAVEDEVEGQGPLAGIETGLTVTTARSALIVAVDMPLLEPALLRLLATRLGPGCRWVVPIADGRPQPLCSAIAASALPDIRDQLSRGERAPWALAHTLGAYRMEPEEWRLADPGGRSFLNVNTPEEFTELS